MLEIFTFDFMIRAFIAGLIIAVVAPLIGIFLVVRRYSLMADTLAHVSLLGVAIGLVTRIYPFITAIAAAILAGAGIEYLRTRKKLFGESVLALFLSGSLALAILLVSWIKGVNVNLFSYLFGSITTVSWSDIWITALSGTLIVACIVLLYNKLFMVSADEEVAIASGIKAERLNFVLVLLSAITVSLATRVVGTLLVGALMVIPVITAMQFKRGFKGTMILAIILSVIAVVAGLFASYYLDLASGGSIVVISLLIFGGSLLVQRGR